MNNNWTKFLSVVLTETSSAKIIINLNYSNVKFNPVNFDLFHVIFTSFIFGQMLIKISIRVNDH